MTNRPQLRLGSTLLPGVLAVVLFAVMAVIVLNTPFEGLTPFPDGISITRELGYAMFDFEALQSTEGAIGDTEPFLVSFLLVAVVLDAALDASIVLAKREHEGEPVTALTSVPGDQGGSTSSGPETPDATTDRSTVSDGGRGDGVDGLDDGTVNKDADDDSTDADDHGSDSTDPDDGTDVSNGGDRA